MRRVCTVSLVLIGLLLAVSLVPVHAQEPADVVLVNALPGVTVDVDIDGVTVVEGLGYGETAPGDVLGLETNQQVTVEVREAGTSTVLGGTAAPNFVPDLGAMMIHYTDGDAVRVTVHEYCVRRLCDGVAAADAWVFANVGPVDIRINGELVTPSEECGSASLGGEPGPYEVVFVEAGTDTVLAGPELVSVAEGEVAVVYLTGSQPLGTLQTLPLGYTLGTQDCTPRQPAPTGPRPAGVLPDVQVLQAIPGVALDVQLGRRFVESLEYGQQFNDDELGGITGGTATVTVSLQGDVLIGPIEIPITGDAGTLVIHLDEGGEPTVTFLDDPVQPLCQDEGGLVLRNTAAGLVTNWVIGTGPVADDEWDSFDVLFTTPPQDNGEQLQRALPSGDYLARPYNYINGEPVTPGNTDLPIRDGRVTLAYLTGVNPLVSPTDPADQFPLPTEADVLLLTYDLANATCEEPAPSPKAPSPPPTASPTSAAEIAYWREFEIWLMEADGSNPRPLVTDLVVETGPAWSPDGTMLTFTGWDPDEAQPEGMTYDLWITDLSGNTTRVLEMPGEELVLEPSWSPDGTRIAFATTQRDLWTVEVDGTNLTRLTNDTDHQSSPAWSPDGSLIAYCDVPVEDNLISGDEDIWVMTADGTQRTQLTDTGSSCSPAWSPDGTRIAFVTFEFVPTPFADHSDVWIMDADGSNPRNLTDDPTRFDGRPDWSPDGSTIAFDSAGLFRVLERPEDEAVIGQDPPPDIYVTPEQGLAKTRLTTGDQADVNPAWRPTQPPPAPSAPATPSPPTTEQTFHSTPADLPQDGF